MSSTAKVYVFELDAHLFLTESFEYMDQKYDEESGSAGVDYTEEDVDVHIGLYQPYVTLMKEVASRFELTINKCLHDVEYEPASRTVLATFKILITPGKYPFLGEVDDYADNLIDHILTTSFEDGCYEGDRTTFYKDDVCVGVFDIRNRRGLRVKLVGVEPGPTREAYEASWRVRVEDKKKIPYSEALADFQAYLEARTREERMMVFNTKIMDYSRRGIYGLGGLFQNICSSDFYATDEERLTAFVRIWGRQVWMPEE